MCLIFKSYWAVLSLVLLVQVLSPWMKYLSESKADLNFAIFVWTSKSCTSSDEIPEYITAKLLVYSNILWDRKVHRFIFIVISPGRRQINYHVLQCWSFTCYLVIAGVRGNRFRLKKLPRNTLNGSHVTACVCECKPWQSFLKKRLGVLKIRDKNFCVCDYFILSTL